MPDVIARNSWSSLSCISLFGFRSRMTVMQSMKLGIDVNRHKEIIVKAVSAILLLLLKHFKVSLTRLAFVKVFSLFFSHYRILFCWDIQYIFLIWAFPGLFVDQLLFSFSWYKGKIDDRKQERRKKCSTVLLNLIRKSLTPSENILTAILNWKKPMSVLGFEPGLPRQNAIALPLVPPPLPIFILCVTLLPDQSCLPIRVYVAALGLRQLHSSSPQVFQPEHHGLHRVQEQVSWSETFVRRQKVPKWAYHWLAEAIWLI